MDTTPDDTKDKIDELISKTLASANALELAAIRFKGRSEGLLAGMLVCLLGLAVAYEAMFPVLRRLGFVVIPKDCPEVVWLAVPLIVTLLGTVLTIRALPKDRPAIATTSESDGDAARTRTPVAQLRSWQAPLPADCALIWARILANAISTASKAGLVHHNLLCEELTNAMLEQLRALGAAPDALVETRELLAIALHNKHDALQVAHDEEHVELLGELRELASQDRTSEVIAAQFAKSLHLEIDCALGDDDMTEAQCLLEEMRRCFSASALPLSGDSEDAYASSVFAVFANTGELELLNELRCLAHGGGPSVHMKVLLGLALTRSPIPGVSDSAELQNLFAGIQEQAEYERSAQDTSSLVQS